MARKAIEKETYRSLFAKTGNQCAFPNCSHPLVDEDNDFIAQICHIEAATSGGERYNPDMSDEQRRSPNNLIVLCYRHHVKTNNEKVYTTEVLHRMKQEHERKWAGRHFELPTDAIDQIIEDELDFWSGLEQKNSNFMAEFDLAMPIKINNNPVDNINDAEQSLQWIEEVFDRISASLNSLPDDIEKFLEKLDGESSSLSDVKYFENPFYNMFWECLNIGVPNNLANIRTNLSVLRAFLLYSSLKSNPENAAIKAELESVKTDLIELAQNQIYVD